MSLTLIAGRAADVFEGDLGGVIDAELAALFPGIGGGDDDPYESEPLPPLAWRALQEKVLQTLEYAPQVTAVDGYQSVYVPVERETVTQLPVGSLADPLQIGSLPALINELQQYAERASLPTDDLGLMQLGLRYLEGDADADLDVQMFVQLLLSARQASVRNLPLWVVL